MLILGLLGMYFDATVVFVMKSSLLFRWTVAILCVNKEPFNFSLWAFRADIQLNLLVLKNKKVWIIRSLFLIYVSGYSRLRIRSILWNKLYYNKGVSDLKACLDNSYHYERSLWKFVINSCYSSCLGNRTRIQAWGSIKKQNMYLLKNIYLLSLCKGGSDIKTRQDYSYHHAC